MNCPFKETVWGFCWGWGTTSIWWSEELLQVLHEWGAGCFRNFINSVIFINPVCSWSALSCTQLSWMCYISECAILTYNNNKNMPKKCKNVKIWPNNMTLHYDKDLNLKNIYREKKFIYQPWMLIRKTMSQDLWGVPYILAHIKVKWRGWFWFVK